MDDYLKRTQEQATAAWINLLNQKRIDELVRALFEQDINLEQALAELQKMKANIQKLIESNRGGDKGIHGFIAEAAEVGIENAKKLIEGLNASCKWLNDNGPADFQRDGIDIQQKFVEKFFSLTENNGVLKHFRDYADFLKKGGKYQIPKDFYEIVIKLWEMPQEEAAKLVTNSVEGKKGLTYANWVKIHDFFTNSGITPDDLEPSLFEYDEVKRDTIKQTIGKEEDAIRKRDQERRDEAYQKSKPTMKEGAKVAAVSAVMEGGAAFCANVAKKRKEGKKLSEFTAADWKEVGIDTGTSTVKGGIRGAAIYTLSNFTATPANVATGLVTATFGVVSQAKMLRNGKINGEEFLINSEALCLDVSISTVSSLLGQTLIPVPVLGAIIGNTAGMFLYDIAKEQGLAQEQDLIQSYRTEINVLNQKLEAQYQALILVLEENLNKFKSMMELAFDPDVNKAFDASIEFARFNGVAENQILKSKSDIDSYFLL